MTKFRLVLAAIMLPFILTACQTSQTGTSSFAGADLLPTPVKKAVKPKPGPPQNEAGWLAVKGPTAIGSKTENQETVRKSPTREIVKPASKTVATAKKSNEAQINEAAWLAVKGPTAIGSKAKQTKTALLLPSKKKVTVTSRAGSKKRSATVGKTKRRSTTVVSGRKRYRSIIARHARANGVPLSLALAVVQVESSYRPSARGAAGEIGLMQLMPRTARHIGYKGKMKNLYNPDTNIRYGMKYLGKAYKLGGGSTCGAILKYNAGHGAKRMNPISRKYCARVRRIMRRRG